MAFETLQMMISAFAAQLAASCQKKRVNRCQRRVRGAKTQFVR